jgi:hypothetical protein
MPVKFSSVVKSEIGWKFISIIETGRLHDCALTDPVRLQYEACQSEIMPGPGKLLRWGVPEGTRASPGSSTGSASGDLIHDDYLLADALIAVLDQLEWAAATDPFISEGFEPLDALRADQPPSSHIDDTSRRWRSTRRSS